MEAQFSLSVQWLINELTVPLQSLLMTNQWDLEIVLTDRGRSVPKTEWAKEATRTAVFPSTNDQLYQPRVFPSHDLVFPSDHIPHGEKPARAPSSGPAITNQPAAVVAIPAF